MSAFDDVLGASPVDNTPLSELVGVDKSQSKVPKASIRNSAATMSLATGGDVVSKYQMMLKEDDEGSTTTYDEAALQLQGRGKELTTKHMMTLLGDSSIPLDQRTKIIVNSPAILAAKPNPTEELRIQALSAPIKNEHPSGVKARDSMAAMFSAIDEDARNRQKITNAHSLTLKEIGVGEAFMGTSAGVLPLGQNIMMGKIAAGFAEKQGENATWAGIKGFLLPGSTKKDIQEKLTLIPLKDRPAAQQQLMDAIAQGASVFTENQIQQFKKAEEFFADGAPISSTEAWVDNILTLVDGFWIADMLKTGKRLTQTKGAPSKGAGAPPQIDDKVIKSDWTLVEEPFNPFAGQLGPGVKKIGIDRVRLGAPDKVHPAEWTLVDEPFNPMAPQIASGTKKLEGVVPAAPLKLAAPSTVESIVKRIEQNSPVHREVPISPYNTVAEVNPEKAKALHESIVAGSDELSEALTGVNREQAITNATFPQHGSPDGAVRHKVDMNPSPADDYRAQVEIDLRSLITDTGATRYTEQEALQAAKAIQNDFTNTTNMVMRENMTTFQLWGDHLKIDAVYSPPSGVWNTQREALAQAEFSLKKYGVRPDEIEILERSGMDFVPSVAGSTASEFAVRVKTKMPLQDKDVSDWEMFTVRGNWLDRLPATGAEGMGSLTRNLLDPGTMFHPALQGSASIISDQAIVLETYMLQMTRNLLNFIDKLDMQQAKQVHEYFIEANAKRLAPNPADLIARGMTDNQIQAVNGWREYWDAAHYLENFDLVKTLKKDSWELFSQSGSQYVAKRANKPAMKPKDAVEVFDHSTGAVVSWDASMVDSLYNQNGFLATFRRPIKIGGKEVDQMIVRNTPTEYLRGIRDTDKLLNRIDGYYTIRYEKDSRFVDRYTRGANGKETKSTVALAKNQADAEKFAREQEALTGDRHVHREDDRGSDLTGNAAWDMNAASGRLAQRTRGVALTSPTGNNLIGVGVHIEHPMESAAKAARSLSGRLIARDTLETAKARLQANHSDVFPEHNGQKVFPTHRDQIQDPVGTFTKKAADVRSQYEYIRFLEEGYINGSDVLIKSVMQGIKNSLGEASLKVPHGSLSQKALSAGEGAAKAVAQVSPSHLAKSVVYHAYIGTSMPMRQWLVQSHQAGRLLAYHPKGYLDGTMAGYWADYLGEVTGTRSTPRGKALQSFIDRSGMVAGVDRNSLVRGMALDFADRSSRGIRTAGKIASIPQRIGFDLGEQFNMVAHLLSVHAKWTSEGRDLLNPTARDLAFTEARTLSLDFNKAGELAHTSGSFAVFTQFVQIAQKAFLFASSRKVDTATKMRLMGYEMLMAGAIVGGTGGVINTARNHFFPDTPPLPVEVEDALNQGIQASLYNAALSQISGENVKIDWSYLNAYKMDGFAKLWSAYVDDGVLAAIAASPSGQIFAVDGFLGAKKNGRIPEALITMRKFFSPISDADYDNASIGRVADKVFSISSGYSTVQKANLVLSLRKKLDASGNVTDNDVATPEMLAAYLGLGTTSSAELYTIGKAISEDKKKHEAEMDVVYRSIIKYYTDEIEAGNTDVQHMQLVSGALMGAFPRASDLAYINKKWSSDLMDKEQKLAVALMKAAGLPSMDHFAGLVRSSTSIPDEEKIQLLEYKKQMDIAGEQADAEMKQIMKRK